MELQIKVWNLGPQDWCWVGQRFSFADGKGVRSRAVARVAARRAAANEEAYRAAKWKPLDF